MIIAYAFLFKVFSLSERKFLFFLNASPKLYVFSHTTRTCLAYNAQNERGTCLTNS